MSGTAVAVVATPAPPERALRRALRRPGARIGLAIAALFLLLTVFAPLVAPYDPADQDLSAALSPPSFDHLLGADQYGRDMLSRVIFGSRYALRRDRGGRTGWRWRLAARSAWSRASSAAAWMPRSCG